MPSTFATHYRYAEMGYTACFEPAILPYNARQAHMDMADTPIVGKGAYVMLGSDDFLLRLMAEQAEQTTPVAPAPISWAWLLTKPPGAVLNGERWPKGRKPGGRS